MYAITSFRFCIEIIHFTFWLKEGWNPEIEWKHVVRKALYIYDYFMKSYLFWRKKRKLKKKRKEAFFGVIDLWIVLFDGWYKLLIYLIFYYNVISGESRGEDVWLKRYFGGWKGSEGVGKRVMGVEQSSFSDANSEVSVSESGITNRSNLSISQEKESDKINNISFIDFLGVGAT